MLRGGLGVFAILPPELRTTIWQIAIASYRQHFSRLHHDSDYTLHAQQKPTPALFDVSAAIRAEVHTSAYLDRSCMLVVHPGGAWADFPLVLHGKPCSVLDAGKAHVPMCRSLKIGIEFPTPRQIGPIASARANVRRIVQLLTQIALKQRMPPIHIFLHTPPSRRDRVYRRSDFEIVVGPFHSLRLPIEPAPTPLLISRNLCWYQTDDGREDSCSLIENAVGQSQDPATAVTSMRQMTIDLKFNLSLVAHGLTAAIPAAFIISKVRETTAELQAWYAQKDVRQPAWLRELALEAASNASNDDVLLGRMVEAAVGRQWGESSAADVVQWSNGHMARVNPYWSE